MKTIKLKLKDIFLKNNSLSDNTLLQYKFLSDNNNNSSSSSGSSRKSNTCNFNKNTLLEVMFKILFFLMLIAAILILPVFFDVEAAQALPSSPLISPLDGEFMVKFRQEYFDDSELVTRKHTGIDISGRPGDKVRASGNGVIVYTGFSNIGGRTVVIKHNDKIRSTYLNILDCFVTSGDRISQGDIIASIGANDDPSFKEPHLHFGIIYMDSYLDPEDILNIDYTSISRFVSLEYINPDVNLQINLK